MARKKPLFGASNYKKKTPKKRPKRQAPPRPEEGEDLNY